MTKPHVVIPSTLYYSGGFGVGVGGMGMGAGYGAGLGGHGGGYGMGGMGRYGGYAGGHHGYRGSSMRLPWLGALAATAVAAGAASVYPRGARSNVSWKEGSKQMSAQVWYGVWCVLFPIVSGCHLVSKDARQRSFPARR